jgi:DNA-binding CsgD family transcriptional regulator/tetratricopeptide (TPR) repeat protein
MMDVVVAPQPLLRPLVGRDREMQELEALVGLPDGRTSAAVVIAGDAGVGKSRLVAELQARAVGAGWRVLVGHCLDFGDSALPYLPFTEIFGRLLADSPELTDALARAHPAVRRLLPRRRPAGDDLVAPSDPIDRAELFDAVQASLEALTADRPLLVLVEDLHWADRSTRDLLSLLFARMSTSASALVATYRSDDLHRRHPLRASVAEWSRLQGVVRMSLDPLDNASVRSLVRFLQPTALHEAEVHEIVRRAEGNAFFAEELVVAAGRDQRAMPDDLADLLLFRLDQLDDATRQVVRAAAVAGRRVSHDLLSRVAGLGKEALDAAIRDAVEANVLLPAEVDGYTFRHALLAEAVYDDLLPGERVRLHTAYIDALSDELLAGTPAEIARHARAAHQWDTAVAASTRAGDEAMSVGGPDEAAHHFEAALALWAERSPTGATDATEVSTLTIKAAEAVAATGNPYRAVQLLQVQLAALHDVLTDDDRARLLLALADATLPIDTELDAVALTDQALAIISSERPTTLRAALLSTRARAYASRGDDVAALRAAGEALASGQQLRLATVVADATTTMARLDERAGQPDASRRALADIVAQARAAGDTAGELRGLHNLGGVHLEAGELPQASLAYERAAETAAAAGRPWAPYGLDGRVLAGLTRYMIGDWDRAIELVDVKGAAPPAPAEAALAIVTFSVAAGRGDTQVLLLEPSLQPWWDKDGMLAVVAGGALIDLLGDDGRLESASSVHDATIRNVTELWSTPWFLARIRLHALLLGQLGSSAGECSESERKVRAVRGDELAAAALEASARGARRLGTAGPEGQAWARRATAEHLRLRWLSGFDSPDSLALRQSWEETVAAFQRLGHSFEVARSQARLAAVLRAAGDSAGARELADRARVTASSLGAVPLQTELRSLGGAPRRRSPGAVGDASLTARETEILALLADGRTNGQIARQLFISTKTVSVHVSNLLAKLGASSRTEAAAIARRRHLLGSR